MTELKTLRFSVVSPSHFFYLIEIQYRDLRYYFEHDFNRVKLLPIFITFPLILEYENESIMLKIDVKVA